MRSMGCDLAAKLTALISSCTGKLFRHEEHFVDGLARPIRVAKFFDGQEKNAAADRLASAEKFLPLFVGADTKDGERTALWHR